MGQSSGLSAPSTQQLTPGSSESNVFDWSSISATTPSPGEAISTSNADPARPFVCEEQDCKRKGKGFMTRASLRYVFHASETNKYGVLTVVQETQGNTQSREKESSQVSVLWQRFPVSERQGQPRKLIGSRRLRGPVS
jgi:hypothetical protein